MTTSSLLSALLAVRQAHHMEAGVDVDDLAPRPTAVSVWINSFAPYERQFA